jgi:hypothetical protein
MTMTAVDFPRLAWTAIVRSPDVPRTAPRLAGPEEPCAAVPLSDTDRDYLDHRFLRDWMVENPEALQTEGGAAMLRTLYPNRF